MTAIDKLADRHERLYERHKAMLGAQRRDSVIIIGDPDYLRTWSGQVTWAVLVNLVARLYKGVRRIRLTLPDNIQRLPDVFFPNAKANLREATLQLLADLEKGYTVEEGEPQNDGGDWIQIHVGASCTPGLTALSV